MSTLLQDLRFALRSFVRAPRFSVPAILALTLGIGATSATLSVVRGVMLEPLPYRSPDRVVTIWETNPGGNIRRNVIAQANFVAWRERTRSFENLGMVGPARLASLIIGNTPEEVEGLFASSCIRDPRRAAGHRTRIHVERRRPGQRPGHGRQPRVLADTPRRALRRRRHDDQVEWCAAHRRRRDAGKASPSLVSGRHF